MPNGVDLERDRSRFASEPWGAAVIALAVAAGCGAAADVPAPPIQPPERFSRAGTAVLAESWWTAFGDPALDRLVAEALRSNLDLATAWERFREARAVVEREAGARWPALDAVGEAATEWPDAEERDTFSLGLAASYEVDLWGRIGSRIAAERYRARATRADYQTVALSLSAEVARTWYRLVEARRQLELIDEQIEANDQVLTLLRSQYGSGQIPSVDILRQEQLLEATRAERLVVEAELAIVAHQLALLLGRAPGQGGAPPSGALPELPPLPATGIPSELLERRPDLRRDYLLLLAADRDVAAAVAERYPRLSLSASAGTEGSASALFRDWFATLAANLVAPLIDGGSRRAEVERSRAVARQRLYQYGQTALEALREVEDALVREEKQAKLVASLESQVRLMQQTYQQLRIEYFNGLSDYIDVLTALTTAQQLQRELLVSRRLLVEYRIALYRALAGGFEPRRSDT